MKQTANTLMMGLLVVGVWYGVGYLHGYQAAEARFEWERYQSDIQPVSTPPSKAQATGRDVPSNTRGKGKESPVTTGQAD